MTADNEQRIEQRPVAEIVAELVAKPGVEDILRRVVKEFAQLPGKTLVLGITLGGLFVAIREEVENDASSDRYFKAVVLDINLSEEEIDRERIDTNFSIADVYRYRDGGATDFPGPLNNGYIRAFKNLPIDEGRRKLSEQQFSVLKFYKATEGFHCPSPLRHPDTFPSVGKDTLYPLPPQLFS